MQPEVENRTDEGDVGHPVVDNRAVVGGGCVGFVVGMVGLTITWDITEFWILGLGPLDTSSFAAVTAAAASGGVVTAVVADTDFASTGLNIVLADLLSSCMAVLTVIFVFALETKSVLGTLGLTGVAMFWWGLYTVPLFTIFSIGVALMAGMATYGIWRWWRDSAGVFSSAP